MHRIFAGMAVWASLFLAGEMALGLLTARVRPGLVGAHLILGVFAAVYICVLHVMVMFHFIGSAKEMKEAAEVLGGDAELLRRLRRLKMQVFPPATLAPILVGAAVILGGEAQTRVWGVGAWPHWVLGVLGLAFNLWAFPIEYRCLLTNLEILNEVDLRLRKAVSPGLFHEGVLRDE